MKNITEKIAIAAAVLSFAGCTEKIQPATPGIGAAESARLYILNEGQMGANNSSVDFYDFSDGSYVADIFGTVNPGIALGLGDTGNDIAVYDGRIWVVLNGSSMVEVMDARTAQHLGTVEIPACRDIAFSGKYAYVTSWTGSYSGGDNREGAVYRINTETLKTEGSIDIGYQPEDITVLGGRIYAANSGGITPGYDNRLSIIDEKTFEVIGYSEIADNICDMVADEDGRLWISSPGDYSSVHSGIYIYDTATGAMADRSAIEDVRVSSMAYSGNILWVIGNEYENQYEADYTPRTRYMLYRIDCRTCEVSATELKDTGASSVVCPYGIWVSPDGMDIFIADAGNFTDPGRIVHLDSGLEYKGAFTTGVIPGHFALFQPE